MGKVIVKHNTTYMKGMYGLSVGQQPGGGANIEQIASNTELRKRLHDLGLTATADEIVAALRDKGASITIEADLTCRIEVPPDAKQARCQTHNQILRREPYSGAVIDGGPLDQFICPVGGGIALVPSTPK